MKIFKLLLIILLIIVVGAVLLLGYLGFIPGLSTIFGSDKPRDLGVKYTYADYVSAAQKNKVKIAVVDSAFACKLSLKWGGSDQVNNSWIFPRGNSNH